MIQIIRNQGVPPPRIILYGVRGIGKTTFGSQTPAPIFIRTENGLAGIEVDTFNLATRLDDVVAQLRYLIDEPHAYKTLVLDSLSGLERLIWDRVVEKYRDQKGNYVSNIEEFPFKAGYLFALEEFMPLLQLFDALQERGMCVLLIAHARPVKQEPPDADAYEKWTPALHKDVVGKLMDWADDVLFVRYQMGVTEAKGRTRGKPVGSGHRMMYTTERPPYHAKNRHRLPDEMEFSWQAFVAGVAAGQPRPQQQTKQAETNQPQPQESKS